MGAGGCRVTLNPDPPLILLLVFCSRRLHEPTAHEDVCHLLPQATVPPPEQEGSAGVGLADLLPTGVSARPLGPNLALALLPVGGGAHPATSQLRA